MESKEKILMTLKDIISTKHPEWSIKIEYDELQGIIDNDYTFAVEVDNDEEPLYFYTKIKCFPWSIERTVENKGEKLSKTFLELITVIEEDYKDIQEYYASDFFQNT